MCKELCSHEAGVLSTLESTMSAEVIAQAP